MEGERSNAGHRARLRERFRQSGGDGLIDRDLLELLLFTAIPRRDTKPLAEALIRRFGSLGGVLAAPLDELLRADGLGEAAAITLKAMHTAAVRVAREDLDGEREVLGSFTKVLAYLRARLGREPVEHFGVLYLDKRNGLIADEVQHRGTIDHTPAYPREIMKRALELGASALILVHNHPSGDPSPSRADIDMTRTIVDAGQRLGIVVHDHLIVTRRAHASLRSMGLI